ncbi:hypothetical protein TCAL_00504 [Tigriopus californicus]|uniref:Calpain catalytic domain-containing protein n=1 Tax=Tigriopus californicus TaxID=6832 RepID=A0A553PDA6_TIGCA|nr:calpain-7-like [Tigriopus californicus]TRY75656.1 hypothetical protein TCAL_00504 [Tigriopus californicus]|eukprot:TCALIF_00504-PA protein Name:"Similar to Capn7 Calpain-7 (Mus musculus)" AED:0.01 eAED:0.01 QI:0/-1/0/1/-1/1/1/0/817
MDHIRALVAQAIQCDRQGRVAKAIELYLKAAEALEENGRLGPTSEEKIQSYRARAHKLSLGLTPTPADQVPPTLTRAKSLLERALNEEESGSGAGSLPLYLEAASVCLALKRTTTQPELATRIESMAKYALDRAEALHQGPQTASQVHMDELLDKLPVVAEPLGALEASSLVLPLPPSPQKTPKSPVKSPSSPLRPPLPSSSIESRYTAEEKAVLGMTSVINGREYVPFMSVDLSEKFTFPIPYTDKHGMLDLAPKQKAKLVRWARPSEFMKQPTMIQVVDCYSVKQTVVSDCSFVASIAISAQHEKRFGKKLITCIIYPQNSKGEPVYNPSGKYMIKLRINGVPRKVVLDDYLPLGQHNEPLCSYSSNRNELWISLLEKAYMKVMGGYDFPGSNSNIDLYVLTGWIPERVSIRAEGQVFDREGTFQKLFQRFHQGDVLVTLATGEMSQSEADRAGLVPTHAYALLDIRQIDGLQLFLLKNPWSHLRWKGNYSERDEVHWTPKLKKALNYDPLNAQNFDNGVFWIDYDSLCKFFDVIYMNWKPELFQHTFVTHQTWHSALGPAKDLYDISNNPQYSLELQGEEGALWILLSRHITDIADFKNNKEYITVLLYKNQGKRVYNPYDPPPYIDGMRINSPHYLCKTVITPETPKKMTLIVSQFNKSTHIHYTLRVYSTIPFILNKISNPYKHEREFVSKWEGKSAGGCDNYRETYPFNPKFECNIDKKTAILVELKGPRDYQIGFGVKCEKLNFEGESPLIFKKKHSGTYKHGYAVLELELLPGIYSIIPTTFKPGQESPFFLQLKSSSPIKCHQVKLSN